MKFSLINISHNFRGRYLLMLLMSIMMGGKIPPVMATSMAVPPVIYTSISSNSDPLGGEVIKATKHTTYTFNTSIEYQGGFLLNCDLYFGVLLPGNDKLLVWVKNGENLNFQNNLMPIVKGISLKEKLLFNLTSVLNREIKYTFTGTEPSGMYLVFSLVVLSDTDPSDPSNWMAYNLKPLFFSVHDG